MQEYLNGLNEEQKKAVLDTEGYVLVFAGAGSGKTRVLTNRIAHLVNGKGVNPENVLAITFTNKAADEMKSRLSTMVPGVERMWVSTIHSMCVRILRNSIGRLEGYNTNFSIYSEIDKTNVLKRIISELKLEDDKYLKNARFYISECKNQDIGPERFRLRTDIKDIGVYYQIYTLYEEALKKSNAMDFDDLLVKTYHLLEEDAEVLEYYSSKFQYVHIDEFQDTNLIQMEIASLLSSYHKNLFVVGDDDQSIYSWRGAEIKNILDFDKTFPNAKIHKLEQNYRSTKHILDLANTVIAGNTARKKKELWTENGEGEKTEVKIAENENEEAQYTAFKIKQLINQGARASDFAVLMRINAISRAYEQEFTKYGIPFKVYGGFKFFERKEIKDLTAYMRILINPLDNESLLRIINTPKRGIGDKTIETLIAYAREYDLSVFDGIVDAERLPLSSGAKSKLFSFRKLISSLMVECAQKPLTEIFATVVEQTAFMSQFEAKSEENYSKRMNVNEYQNAIEEFAKINPNATLADYLNSITLSSDTDEIEEGNYVSVATIHSVKGLEFPYVFISGLDETVFPVSRASESETDMEEERRLMYVAITRAKKKLFLTRARSRFLYGNRQYTAQSTFLNELAPKLGLARPKPANPYGSYSFGGYSSSYRGSYDEQSPTPGVSMGGYSSGGAKSFSSGTKPEQKNSSFAGYKSGKKVVHQKFGTGTIIQVKGEDKNLIIDVAFPGVGIKSLAVAYAPIKLID
ncbi:MAG: ATP-dependent DNA helicase PcrA [Clostridiales bacterium]|nr:ATP-dependent DNA helicase PcrA [Clostridiales bacterium]